MKTQAISNQHFTAGKIIFVNEKGAQNITENLETVLAPQIQEQLAVVKDALKRKPYDLFISDSKEIKGFFEVNANTNFSNVIANDALRKGNPAIFCESRPERFISASFEAMRNFEGIEHFGQLTKNHNSIFKRILESIIS